MSMGIYKIENLVNGKCYIGQSINITKRWNNHKAVAFCENYSGYNYPQYRAIRKYGIDNFEFSIVELCECNELNTLEIKYIKEYRSHILENGYNLDTGGSAQHFHKLSCEKVREIIDLLQTTDLTSEEIGDLFNVTGRTIRGINTGEYSHIEGVSYPVRKYSVSKKDGKRYRLHSVDKPNYFCKICGKEITGVSQYCKPCSQKKVINRPSPIEIAADVKQVGFSGVGKKYGVDGNTVKEWCRNYGIPFLKTELIQWYDDQ